jgi:hypothetical protein
MNIPVRGRSHQPESGGYKADFIACLKDLTRSNVPCAFDNYFVLMQRTGNRV